MPGFLLSQYSFLKAGSVPSCWVTRYCVGVSRFLSSSSGGFTNVLMVPPAGGGALGAPAAASSPVRPAESPLAPPAHAARRRSAIVPARPATPARRAFSAVIATLRGIFARTLDAVEGLLDSKVVRRVWRP